MNSHLDTYLMNRDDRLMAEAGGDGERACRLLWEHSEHFDGEYVIGYSTELGMRRRLGLPTVECERKLRSAQAAEDAAIQRWKERNL